MFRGEKEEVLDLTLDPETEPLSYRAAKRHVQDRYMKRLMSYREQMVDDFAVLYAERFTADELKSIADFYRSSTGAKFIVAMPELIQAGAQIGIKYSRRALEDETGHKPQ